MDGKNTPKFTDNDAVASSSIALSRPWGWQLIVDCFGCSETVCRDLDNAYEFLDKGCDFLGMTKQSQPYVFKTCERAYPGKPGLSGWVAIIESAIQIHTSAYNAFVSIDIYSCKEFDKREVELLVERWFKPAFMETVLIQRGRDFNTRVARTRVSAPEGITCH